MNSKEIFKLAVRLLGLVFLYHGLTDLPGIIAVVWPLNLLGIIMIIWPFLVAFWLLRGAPWLVDLAYHEDED